MTVVDMDHLDDLSIEQRLDMLDAVWDSLARDPAAAHRLPLSDEQRDILRQRNADYEQGRDSGQEWQAIKRQTLDRLK